MGNGAKLIRFWYMYRDSGNFKQHGAVAFSNPNNRSLKEIESGIRKYLIEGECFCHKEWQLPDLHFIKEGSPPFMKKVRYPYHEYIGIKLVENPQYLPVESIDDFLERIAAETP
jgi:hypothetical protein